MCVCVCVKQMRSEDAWSPWESCDDPMKQIPEVEWHRLLIQYGPPLELKSSVLYSFMMPRSSTVHQTVVRGDAGTSQIDAGTKEYYEMLIDRAVQLELRDSTTSEQIEKDLPRTFGDDKTVVSTEDGQQMLRRILLSHAVHNPEVGYCQSLNNIAGLLMCIPNMAEHRVFTVLSAITMLFEDWYSCTMFGVRRDMVVIEQVVTARFRGLTQRAEELGVPLSLVLSGYMLQLFVGSVPSSSVLRLLDGFCFAVKKERRHPFGLIIGALLTVLRHAEAKLMNVESLEEFKQAVDQSLNSLLNPDVFLSKSR